MPRRYVYYLSIAAVLAAFAAFAFIEFGRLFLMNEYRQWSEGAAFYNPLIVFSPANVFDAHAFSVAFSRAFNFEVVAGITGVCGLNATCHDAFHIALLTASGLLLGAALLRLFPGKPVLFIAGSVLFMFSAQPVMDALSWQATLLDKMALFYCALGTYLAIRIDLRRSDVPYAIGTNVVMLLIAIAAYNSKEAAFPLVPSLVVLLICKSAGGAQITRQSITAAVRKSLALLALPSLYALFHIAVVFTDRMFWSVSEGRRVTGGHAGFNFFQYVVYLFNLQPLGYSFHVYPYAPDPFLVWFGVAVVAVVAGAAVLVARIASRNTALMWYWALFSFLVAMLIPLRTAGPSPFYLLVPLYFLAILFCASAVAVWDAAQAAAAKAAVQVAVAFALVLHVWGLTWPYPGYMHIAQMSDNFTSALSAVRKHMGVVPPHSILFRWPENEPLSYMFLGSKGVHGLSRFLLPPGSPAETVSAMDASIQDQSYAELPRAPAKPGEMIVVLGPALKLERIESAR